VAVSGSVLNIGQETAENMSLVAIFFDGQNQITGFTQYQFDSLLPPEATLPFSFDTAPPGGQTLRVEMVVQGQKIIMTEE
jgi:hypothetical protein